MDVRTRGSYEIEDRELIAEGADLRVQVLTLAPGQCVPWHYHSEVTDSFVCLEGETIIETKAPGQIHKLEPGQRCAVGPKTAHTVYGSGDDRCKFMVIQGVGVYDFMPVGDKRRNLPKTSARAADAAMPDISTVRVTTKTERTGPVQTMGIRGNPA